MRSNKKRKSSLQKSGHGSDSVQANAQDSADSDLRYVGKCSHFRENKYFFDAVVIKGQVMRKGDVVLLQNAEPDEKPYVCLIQVCTGKQDSLHFHLNIEKYLFSLLALLAANLTVVTYTNDYFFVTILDTNCTPS